ncbi:MAG TPA: hypothetical protein VFU40_03715 [Gemmatimonadales bacterium]|nr:hypothetical protein [Gemmatimonadales bacterium]
MGFFGLVFWMLVLWCAFRWWTRYERRRVPAYGPYSGWYDSGEFYDRRPREPAQRRSESAENQQAYIESLESRVSELEERLDFTERLLAERREPASQS